MKNVVAPLAVSTVLALVAGCPSGGSKETKPDQGAEKTTGYKIGQCKFLDDGKTDAPPWVCRPMAVEGVAVSARGSAETTGGGVNFQETMATTRARVELAKMYGVHVRNMVKDYVGKTGSADQETIDAAAENVSKLITDQDIAGSRVLDTVVNPNTKVMWVLVGIDAKVATEVAANAVKTSMANQRAQWQKFQAKKADDEMAAEIAKMSAEKAGTVQDYPPPAK